MGGFAGEPMLGQRWGRAEVAVGPRGMQKLFGWVEDLQQRGFLRLFGVLSSQLASWAVDPAWLGHGVERVMLG